MKTGYLSRQSPRLLIFPLSPCDVLLNPQIRMRLYPYQDGNFTYNSKYRRHTYSITNTHSPITLANLSSINLVFIFRCSSFYLTFTSSFHNKTQSSPPRNTVYSSFSLSSHRHSYISLLFHSRFIVS